MKLITQTYISPNPTQGKFENVFIEEIGYTIKRKDKYLRIEFSMYYLRDTQEIKICENAFLAFDSNTYNRATFRLSSDSEEEEPRGLIAYLTSNNGVYPTDYKMVNWGQPTFTQVVSFLSGGNLNDMEINPINDFVKAWIKNNLIMNGELVGSQFEFVE